MEWLAVDQRTLLTHLLTYFDRESYLNPILLKVNSLKKQTVNTINEAIGTGLFEQGSQSGDEALFTIMAGHPSDVVRCWACYNIGKNEELSIAEVLDQIQPFAADKHFGVREIAWLSVRHRIAEKLDESIHILSGWTSHEDGNIRRFASEATRPRGVWCEHIAMLKQQPELALPILEPMKSDKVKYVQDSVGNWLNDASKTQTDFVRNLCQAWEKESNTKETKYILKKALRTINK